MNKTNAINCAMLGYEAPQWWRDTLNTAEDTHRVLVSNFVTSISNAFEKQREKLENEQANGADPAHPDEYRMILSNHEGREDKGGLA
ncbi:MAG: hypothetical protein KIT45_14835 [Fimbriimonadia bacterium]|nr:hypothetical protein [Fimbriimonadia bacterium]